MIEVLIVVAILALLIVIFLNYFNPLKKRDRAIDARRKADLQRLSTALEDYYNDHNCYPSEVLCTPAEKADDLKPYLGTIPCDPATHQSYDYQPEDSDCPQYYRIYTHLYWQEDPDIARVGCEFGCGRPHYDYEYGVSSPNVNLEGADNCKEWCACQGEDCNNVRNECCEDPNNPSGCDITSSRCYCCEEATTWCGSECPPGL